MEGDDPHEVEEGGASGELREGNQRSGNGGLFVDKPEDEQFKGKRASHYNEFKVLQAFKARMQNIGDDDEDEEDEEDEGKDEE
jgi:hypothetical protein